MAFAARGCSPLPRTRSTLRSRSDGRWLAYQVDQSDQPEIFVRPFPDVDGGMWKISVDGGTQPTWSHSGEEIFFVSGASLMSAHVRTDSGFQHDQPQEIITASGASLLGIGRSYDVAEDGQRVLGNFFVRGTGEANRIVIVTNWFAELERPVPTG